MSLSTLSLSAKLEPTLLSNHPWVYRNHLPKHALQTGDWVRVQAGKACRVGLYDDESAIALRLFSDKGVPNYAWVDSRIKDALTLRDTFINQEITNAYRLLFGEGDFLPGVTVDLYERYAVLQTYAKSVEVIVPDIVKSLAKHLNLRGIVQKTQTGLEPRYGKLPPPELTIQENGLRLIANLYEGQKTGLFLDHRDNRATLKGVCKGKRVLNLFSYTGAFSLYAARGGASHITSVDIAQAANEDAKRNFAMNGFEPQAHEFITADCFELLNTYAREKRQFDIVVLDPPSLARNKKSKFTALRAYKKLNTLALKCVAPGGLLASASCTSQVSPEDFKGVLGDAANDAEVRLQIAHEAGHAPDHPVPATFPEGRYLKFVMARSLRVV